MPFVSDKICDMMSSVLSFTPKDPVEPRVRKDTIEDIKAKWDDEKTEKRKRNDIIKDKIRAMSKMVRFFKVLKDEGENIKKLKALSPSGKLRAGILSKGSAGVIDELAEFAKAQEEDRKNMKLPGLMDGKEKKRKQRASFFRGMEYINRGK